MSQALLRADAGPGGIKGERLPGRKTAAAKAGDLGASFCGPRLGPPGQMSPEEKGPPPWRVRSASFSATPPPSTHPLHLLVILGIHRTSTGSPEQSSTFSLHEERASVLPCEYLSPVSPDSVGGSITNS